MKDTNTIQDMLYLIQVLTFICYTYIIYTNIRQMRVCNSDNPVNITLKVIGGKWKPLLLWHLDQKTLRFSELQKEITGITQKMLTSQLRELEKDGLIKRKIFPVIPPKVEYSITPYGKTLRPVLVSMSTWGKNHKKLDEKYI